MKGEFGFVPAPAVHDILADGKAQVLDVIKHAYLLHGAGQTVNPSSHFLRFPHDPTSRIIALPAWIGADVDLAGIKWISSFPANLSRGLPRASAVIVINDAQTGRPLACIEASQISAARTAASAALAAAALGAGRTSLGRVGYIGTGLIAGYVHSYLTAMKWRFDEVNVFDTDRSRAQRFGDRLGPAAPRGRACDNVEELVRSSDLIVFATTAGAPHVTDPDWFDRHPVVLHLSLRDLGTQIILSSVNVVDDVDHCLTANTSPHLAEQEVGHRGFIDATLPEVLEEKFVAPVDETVIFSPFGLGVLDLALARYVHNAAGAAGTSVLIPDFFAGLDPDGSL